jgi:hypothetical protein
LAYSRWQKVEVLSDSLPNDITPTDSLRILFVADPQIPRFSNELPFPLGSVTRWDLDRFLRKTFVRAISTFKPQVVVFLGDLIDEGSEVEDEETYRHYSDRFHSIYENVEEIIKTKIFIPGDNDIGGEEDDPITDEKIERFNLHFPAKPIYRLRGNSGSLLEEIQTDLDSNERVVEIIPVSLLTQRLDFVAIDPPTRNTFRIVVSHLPIMKLNESEYLTENVSRSNEIESFLENFSRSNEIESVIENSLTFNASNWSSEKPIENDIHNFSKNVLKHFQPTLIISAHDHRGMDFVGSRKTGKEIRNETFSSENDPTFFVLKLPSFVENDLQSFESGFIHEIEVPTCSYRMGTEDIAFGLGIIFNLNGSDPPMMIYTNLWLPKRFNLLNIYVGALLTSFALFYFKRRKSKKSFSSSLTKYTKLV